MGILNISFAFLAIHLSFTHVHVKDEDIASSFFIYIWFYSKIYCSPTKQADNDIYDIVLGFKNKCWSINYHFTWQKVEVKFLLSFLVSNICFINYGSSLNY